MVRFVDKASQLNLSTLILNPNVNFNHALTVWERHFVDDNSTNDSKGKCPAKSYYMIAHSAGGGCASDICAKYCIYVSRESNEGADEVAVVYGFLF